MDTVTALGLIAGSLTTLSFAPQVARAWRTRSTADLSLAMLVVFLAGVLLWLAYGVVKGDVAIIAANAVTAVQKLNIAADATNRLQDNYLTGLAQAYWAQAEQEIEQKKDQEAQVALQAAAPYLQEAVKNAVQSTEIANPSNSFNWAFRAQIYRKLIGIDEGFDDWALDMYEKAIKLETSNPTLYNEVGQVYHHRGLPPEFESELLSFPMGAHDDMCDALAYSWHALGFTSCTEWAPPLDEPGIEDEGVYSGPY